MAVLMRAAALPQSTERKTMEDGGRESRLSRIDVQYSKIGTVETMQDLKNWMDNICDTYRADALAREKGLFAVNCDQLLDELKSVSLLGFEQNEISYAANLVEDLGRMRRRDIANRIKAAIVNDDAAQLKILLLNVLKKRKKPMDVLVELEIKRWLPWAAYYGAMKCTSLLTEKFLGYLIGAEANRNDMIDEKENDPVHQAIQGRHPNLLHHLLHWDNLDFNVKVHSKTRENAELIALLDEFVKRSYRIMSPFQEWNNREKWIAAEETFKTLKENVMNNGVEEAIEVFERDSEKTRAQLLEIEHVIRDSFLWFEDSNHRKQFLESMKNNANMKVWDDSFATYNSVMSLTISQFGIPAWDTAFGELLLERENILEKIVRIQTRLLQTPQNPLPLNAPQPIMHLIPSYKHIYKNQEALRFVLLDVAAETFGELYCGDPKGLARVIEKASLIVIKNVINKRRPQKREERIQLDSDKRRREFNMKARVNLANYECDELFDLWDFARGMLIYNTLPAITNALTTLHNHPSVNIVNIDNHFKEAAHSNNGWQDVMVHVKLDNLPQEYTLEESLVCEIQLALKPLVVARRSLGGHNAYSLYRLANEFKSFVTRIDRTDQKERKRKVVNEENREVLHDEQMMFEVQQLYMNVESDEKQQIVNDESILFNEVRTCPMILDRFADSVSWNSLEREVYIKSLYNPQWSWSKAQNVVENHEVYLGMRFIDADWDHFWMLFDVNRSEPREHMSLGLFVSSRVFHERASFQRARFRSMDQLPDDIRQIRDKYESGS